MNTQENTDRDSVESTALLAVAPFTPDAYGGMKDADGDRVITCTDECPPCTLYKEPMVDADAWFMCPKCGRLGQRMEEASHRQGPRGVSSALVRMWGGEDVACWVVAEEGCRLK
jgi:hypothetical protein